MKNPIKSLLNADAQFARAQAVYAKKTAALRDAKPVIDRSNRQRHELAYSLRQQGLTFKAIAEELGLKYAESARVLAVKGECAREIPTDSIKNLSIRAQNAILNTRKLPDTDSRWSIRDHTRAEILKFISLDDLTDMPNCGQKTFIEIRNWLQKSSSDKYRRS